jgi:hypothetical protein
VLSYRNQVRFDRDLTVSVDSVFARLKAGDRDVLALVRGFVAPAYEVLEREWRVRLPESTPQARPASRSFSFASGWSEWTSGTTGDKTVPTTLLPLLGAAAGTPRLDIEYRWRAVITDATAEFNALLPRDVSITAEVILQVESRTPGKGDWLAAGVDHAALEDLARAMSIRVNTSYRQYLRETFGVHVTTMRPRQEE